MNSIFVMNRRARFNRTGGILVGILVVALCGGLGMAEYTKASNDRPQTSASNLSIFDPFVLCRTPLVVGDRGGTIPVVRSIGLLQLSEPPVVRVSARPVVRSPFKPCSQTASSTTGSVSKASSASKTSSLSNPTKIGTPKKLKG